LLTPQGEHKLALYVSAAWDLFTDCSDVFANIRLDGHTVARTALVHTTTATSQQYASSQPVKMRKAFQLSERLVFPVDWDATNDCPALGRLEITLHGNLPVQHSFVFLGCTSLSCADVVEMNDAHDKEHRVLDLIQSEFVDTQPYVTATGQVAVRAKYQGSGTTKEQDLSLATVDVAVMEAAGLELPRRLRAVRLASCLLEDPTRSTDEAEALLLSKDRDGPERSPPVVHAVVMWNGIVAGRTEIAVETHNPITELQVPNFRLTVPEALDLLDCRLSIELYLERPYKGVALGGLYLGRVLLQDRFLSTTCGAIKPAATRGRGGRRAPPVNPWLDLTCSVYEEDNVNEGIVGGVRLKATYTPANTPEGESAKDSLIEAAPSLAGEVKRMQSVLEGRLVLLNQAAARPQSQGTSADGAAAAKGGASVRLKLGVLAAAKLHKHAKYGRCHAMVRVQWNGVRVFQTGFVRDTNNPVWPECEHTAVVIPPHLHLTECSLELVVLDKLKAFDGCKELGTVRAVCMSVLECTHHTSA